MPRLLLVTALVLAGCAASRQYFEPTERVRGATLQGYPESIYELTGPQGHFGEAKVWSRGSYRGEGGTVVHVSIEIHNTSGQNVELKSQDVRLDPVHTEDGVLTDLAPAETQTYNVPAATIREVRLHFVLPPGTTPGEVNAFRVRWHVTNGAQAYSQLTPFVQEDRRYGYAYGPMYGQVYGYAYYCNAFDPFCFYPGPYYHGGYYGRVYGPGIGGMGPSRVVVHPRR